MFFQELKRATFNKNFFMVIILSITLLLISSYDPVWRNVIGKDKVGDLTQEGARTIAIIYANKYHIWIESYRYLCIIFPMILLLPYGFSYVKERKNKFNFLVMSRYGRIKYLVNKFIVIPLSGALALAVAEVLYYIGLSIVARSEILTPFLLYPRGIFSEIFNYAPDTYILITILMHFFLDFTLGVFFLGITSFCTKKVSVYLIPFGIYLILDITISNISKLQNYSILTTYNFMFREGYSIYNYLVTNVILLISGIILFVINERRRLING